MQGNKKRIGILTGGGDCPGLNASIRAIAKTAILDYDMEVIGIKDGFLGLIENRFSNISYEDVSGILALGGTFLGASNKANPFRHPDFKGRFKDISDLTVENYCAMELNGLLIGEPSLSGKPSKVYLFFLLLSSNRHGHPSEDGFSPGL